MNARLPSRLLIVTDRHQARGPLADIVHEAVRAGAHWIWVRDRDLPPGERRGLAVALLAITRRAQAKLTVGADAILGVSAHDDADVAAAVAAGADYATLSPIFATTSKPGYGPELGLAALTRAARHGLPLLALGGVMPERAHECVAAGAAGVAVMGEVMRAAGPPSRVGEVVCGFLDALCVPANRR